MSFLRVIIPTFNGGKLLPRMVDCVRKQTCQDYHLIIVDDMSADDTYEVAKSLMPDKLIKMRHKGYAGGARNAALKYFSDDLYTIFIDDDDILLGDDVFEKIKTKAEDANFPDLIRLNYIKTKLSTGLHGNHHDRYPKTVTPKDICLDITRAMPFAKVVRTDKCVPFPEGVVMEDGYHHILQCDVCETAAVIHDDCYEWLVREGTLSTSHNMMYESSGYMLIAMLMRHEFIHDWAKEASIKLIEWIKTYMIRR